MSNLDQVREKKTKININGKEMVVRYDLNALAELEENFGSLEDLENALNTGGMKNLRKILWIGLKHEDENLTEKEVGAAFDLKSLVNVGTIIKEALTGSMPEPEETTEEEKEKNVTSQAQK